jgi:carbonic anhydrase
MPIRRLLSGYQRFREGDWPELRALFLRLAEGQTPDTLVIACSDSRVDPTRVFDGAPGELFVIRNVAALTPPYAPDTGYHGTSAALEFAVNALEVRQIVVMGHGRCGGCTALLTGAPEGCGEFVAPWMAIAAAAAERARFRCQALPADATSASPALQRALEEESVRESLTNLMTYPWIAERVARGTLRLDGLWFDILLGELWRLGDDARFAKVEGAAG